MRIVANDREVGTKENGCTLCGATWGEYYEEIDGQKLFFCCNICALEFKNMINEAKKRTNWIKIDELTIKGNYYTGRTCTAKNENREYKFYVKFGNEGEITTFKEIT
ncbi:MAG: TA0938 family protein [Thermoprotei archaeon]|jgi:hypothetical protein